MKIKSIIVCILILLVQSISFGKSKTILLIIPQIKEIKLENRKLPDPKLCLNTALNQVQMLYSYAYQQWDACVAANASNCYSQFQNFTNAGMAYIENQLNGCNGIMII
jgi:hypothetical protein